MRKRLGAVAQSGDVVLPGRRQTRRHGSCSPGRRLARAITAAAGFGLTLTLAWPCMLRAQSVDVDAGPHTPPPKALEHYERGRKEYLAGRYREALYELKAALELDPNSPNLVYNVARVYEDLGELDAAITHYRRYRDLLPSSAIEEREKTLKTIRRLQGAKGTLTAERVKREQGAEPKPAASHDAPDSTSSGGRADLAFWLTASTSLVLAAGGGVTGVLALRRENQVKEFVLGKDGSYDDRQQLRDEADRLALTSDILFATAGTALLTAVVLFLARSPDDGDDGGDAADTARFSLRPAPAGASLQWRATF